MNNTANTSWKRAREIFEEALRHPPEIQRRHARQACGTDRSLLIEVESLLESYEQADSFLETPAVIHIANETQPHTHQLHPGQLLSHYEIKDFIGAGGMGEVYLALDTQLNRNVAIKLVRVGLVPEAQARNRLLREARAAALLEHPNICPIYEISEANGFSFIVMQYVLGTTLDDILFEKGVDISTALDLAEQIAEGLAEAHSAGVIHRDIKPANIIISEKGQAKILDFGLAKFIEAETCNDAASRMESSGGVMGTVPYMSPEQLLGLRVDSRTDVFSFGSMLFEMLGGTPAFGRESNADTISAILNKEPDWSHIPSRLRPYLQRCLAKDPADRYPSASELADRMFEKRTSGQVKFTKKSGSTGSIRMDPATDLADVNTLPLYSRQSAEEGILHSLPESSHGGRLLETPWMVPITLIGPVVILLAIGITFTFWQSRAYSKGEVPKQSVNSNAETPKQLYPFGKAPEQFFSRAQILTNIGLVAIPGGGFTMGRDDGRDNERPAFQAGIMPFFMDKTEVTNSEYYQFLREANYKQVPSHWVNGKPIPGQEMFPVRFVNIEDINNFIKWRSHRDGVTYRLPTEEEWEYAARNGSQATLYPWGDKFDVKCAVINEASNEPKPVGSNSCPNEWGVVDLIGNVWEWTSSPPSLYWESKGLLRRMGEPWFMVRGGSAFQKSSGRLAITSTFRLEMKGDKRSPELGFRLVSSNTPWND